MEHEVTHEVGARTEIGSRRKGNSVASLKSDVQQIAVAIGARVVVNIETLFPREEHRVLNETYFSRSEANGLNAESKN